MASVSMGDNMTMAEKPLTFDGNKTDQNEMITIEIDLTDPNDLMQKLEMIDLTEEETDALLERALFINKKLKEYERMDNPQLARKSFTVSAPASQHPRNQTGRGISTPNLPSMGYRDPPILKTNSLARLQSGNLLLSSRPRANQQEELMLNPYSYHSAKPIRVMGANSNSLMMDKNQRQGRMDYY